MINKNEKNFRLLIRQMIKESHDEIVNDVISQSVPHEKSQNAVENILDRLGGQFLNKIKNDFTNLRNNMTQKNFDLSEHKESIISILGSLALETVLHYGYLSKQDPTTTKKTLNSIVNIVTNLKNLDTNTQKGVSKQVEELINAFSTKVSAITSPIKKPHSDTTKKSETVETEKDSKAQGLNSTPKFGDDSFERDDSNFEEELKRLVGESRKRTKR
jgi:hypothetical protein